MPSLNFQKQFASKVKRNAKPGTIRGPRKRPFKSGDMLYLFTGMRTNNCEPLAVRRCVGTANVLVCENHDREKRVVVLVFMDRTVLLTGEALELFASLDGFRNSKEMLDFFRPRFNYSVPALFEDSRLQCFRGQWIAWSNKWFAYFYNLRVSPLDNLRDLSIL